jgi:AAA family ATP:ADP antiporter
MTRFSLSVALMILPFAALGSSGVYMLYPGLWVGSALNTADNGCAYSINQSAKEALYTPTSRDEKYKAKAFIDMFIQRVAKAVAVLLSLFITTRELFKDFGSVRWLSLVTIALGVAWVLIARYAGRRFHELSG